MLQSFFFGFAASCCEAAAELRPVKEEVPDWEEMELGQRAGLPLVQAAKEEVPLDAAVVKDEKPLDASVAKDGEHVDDGCTNAATPEAAGPPEEEGPSAPDPVKTESVQKWLSGKVKEECDGPA